NKSIILAVILFAILIEGTVEYIKLSFQKKMCAEIIGAFLFALVIAIAYKLDFFYAWLGLEPIIPYLGNVLTALVMARGSNYMFDLIGKFTEAEEELDTILKGDEARPVDEVNEDRVNHEMDEGVG
ncbi:MAG: hypothetical protein J6U15_07560, partial [Lachnospiraceae bacterium]|nr:hypothetical protein [Lachnospiraceae bacterium]